jgi:hypothetical protein
MQAARVCLILGWLCLPLAIWPGPCAAEEEQFTQAIQPLLKTHCVPCHNVDVRKSGVRLDHLTATAEDSQIGLYKAIRKVLEEGTMPPADQTQPTEAEARLLDEWLAAQIVAAQSRVAPRNGLARRLTVPQYRNTLQELLRLEEDLTDSLPPDGVSKEGFTNNAQTLGLSPLQVEAYFQIAERALAEALVDETKPPVIQHFRMELGAGLNREPCPDNLILGANSALLPNADFVVTEPDPVKPFPFQPFRMQRVFDFIEGYQGNDTVRGWRHYDSIYHAVFACVRGTPGYPFGDAWQTVPAGLLLRPAIPSPEIFGQSDTYGPMANFKISLRELPNHGRFRVRVQAARYPDALLLEKGTALRAPTEGPAPLVLPLTADGFAHGEVAEAGIYQVDVQTAPGGPGGKLALQLADRHFAGALHEAEKPAEGMDLLTTPLLVVRLPAGPVEARLRLHDNARLRGLVCSRLPEEHPLARRFAAMEQRNPSLGVHIGLRRDCGSTLARVGQPQTVRGTELQEYVFGGAINDFPAPDVEENNVNYLAGVREIGVRHEYTDGRDMPRLLIRSIEFEGPYYETWPPTSHRQLLPELPSKNDPAAYARDVLSRFATRAFRRPVTAAELDSLVAVWKGARDRGETERQALVDSFLVVLTAPQFLFLIEQSATPEPEDLDDFELASKLSYFLWNGPPDNRLLSLAAEGKLRGALDAEFDRLVQDPRFERFVSEFGSQWLALDKFDVLAVDMKQFPRLTRDTKAELRREPVEFLKHLFDQNLAARHLVASDRIVANEAVATYYGLGNRVESGFAFVPVVNPGNHLGGVLSQAGILAGLSDGREGNPVKRGAWLARKIVAEPPDDPPPNVPQLPKEGGASSLREKLELHRSQRGCQNCHEGIDPWGVPFETYDAAGLYRQIQPGHARSRLPDGTEVTDLDELKAYLGRDRIDQVAFSFLKHATGYALGRSLGYNELTSLRAQARSFAEQDYPLRDLLRSVVLSDLFLKK